LRHISDKSLGAELEPFHHGQVGKQFVSHFLYCHIGLHRHNRCRDQFSCPRCYCLHPQQSAGILFGHHLDKAGGVEIHQGARHTVQTKNARIDS
tara:strand:+ start:10492 stop:10773 length:282 start_codon:yes stop_codon:yes gene_type:complete